MDRHRLPVRRGLRALLCLALICVPVTFSSCHAMTYRVGMGSNNIGKYETHQYYLFFGLIRLNEVDIQRVVSDYHSYDVEVGFAYRDGFFSTMGDFFVSTLFFLPLTVTRQAVTVKY